MGKRCTKCGKEKPTSDFYRHATLRDGLHTSCKECMCRRMRLVRARRRKQAVNVATRKCSQCKQQKAASCFNKNGNAPDGLDSPCRACRTMKGYNKDLYGMSEDEYFSLIEIQSNLCAICGRPPGPKEKVLCIDHDHDSGHVRGLLCHQCNWGLGHFRDNTNTLGRAIGYLQKHA